MELRELISLAVDSLRLKQHNLVCESLELGMNTPKELDEKIEVNAEKIRLLISLLDKMGGYVSE